MKPLLDRFNEKYMPEPNSGCWIWLGYIRPDGYGEIQRGRRGEGTALAHRISYELFKGEIPAHLETGHLCRVRCCVNPDHLETVPRRISIARGDGPRVHKEMYAQMTHCRAGHLYTPLNTYEWKTKKGYTARRCRACNRLRMQQYRS